MDYNKRIIMDVVDKYLALVRSLQVKAEEAERRRLEEEKREQEKRAASQSKRKP
jgi:hypothetical protein